MPAVFQQLQELDDKRIKQMENYLRKGVEIERSVYPIINKCLDGIIRAADSINPEQVCCHTHRTGCRLLERFQGVPAPEQRQLEHLNALWCWNWAKILTIVTFWKIFVPNVRGIWAADGSNVPVGTPLIDALENSLGMTSGRCCCSQMRCDTLR